MVMDEGTSECLSFETEWGFFFVFFGRPFSSFSQRKILNCLVYSFTLCCAFQILYRFKFFESTERTEVHLTLTFQATHQCQRAAGLSLLSFYFLPACRRSNLLIKLRLSEQQVAASFKETLINLCRYFALNTA